jgi:hypothetical protein
MYDFEGFLHYYKFHNIVVHYYKMTSTKKGKDLVSAHIFRDIYDKYKERAESERYDVKEYLNNLLEAWLQKEEFINTFAGHLSIDSLQENVITLKDTKEKKLVDVYLSDHKLRCELCNLTDCIHTIYVWASPEIGRITNTTGRSKNITFPEAGQLT